MKMVSVWCMLLAGAVLLTAQPHEMMEGGRLKRPMERLESYKKIQMIEALKLDEESGLKLVGRYNKHRENVKQLEESRAALVDKLELQLKSNAADSELQRSFNEFYELEKKIGESRKKFLEDLKEIFTTKQVAEYMIFERNFMTDLRNVVKDIQKERRQRN